MKKILIFAAMAVAFASCKKEKPEETPTNNTPTPTGNNATYGTVPTDAQGALYAIRTVAYYETGDSLETTGPYMAWFESSSQTKDVGALTCNGDSLQIKAPFGNVNYPWYTGSFIVANQSKCDWKLAGSSSYGSWTYSDNSGYAHTYAAEIPESINSGSPLRLKFKTETCDQVVIRVMDGSGTETQKVVSGGNVDVTFSAADMAPVVDDTDQITINILTLKWHSTTLGGKKIYVVRENVFAQNVDVN